MQRHVGKLIGLLLGLLVAGGRGAIVGFIIGLLYDRWRMDAGESSVKTFPSTAQKIEQSTYTVGVIVLGAKMAKADGRVSRQEIEAFKRVFRIPEAQVAEVGNLFDQARLSAAGYEPYAARLAHVFRHNTAVLEEILTGLFLVAVADSVGLSRAEASFLSRVATLFGFSTADFARIAARSGVRLPDQQQAAPRNESFVVLGLSETASAEEIKNTYRALIRKHHPDALVAQGLPPELIAQATEKMKRINAAYDSICKLKGIK